MIEFRGGKAVRVNRKCAGCLEECKQHEEVKILHCPHFRKVDKA